MTRTRASAKAAGTNMETSTVTFLAERLGDDRIERRRPNGANDRGDVTGIKTIRGGRVVLEIKDHNGQVKVKPWLDEAEVERANDDAAIAAVVFKRSRIGYNSADQHGVLMTLETFARLLEGGAPFEHVVIDDPMTEVTV